MVDFVEAAELGRKLGRVEIASEDLIRCVFFSDSASDEQRRLCLRLAEEVGVDIADLGDVSN